MVNTELRPAAEKRRIATVVSSVPEAVRAAWRAARSVAPPVPMIRREPNRRPAMTRLSSSVGATPGPGRLAEPESGPISGRGAVPGRSEEHTSELQSRGHLVCRLLLEKKE